MDTGNVVAVLLLTVALVVPLSPATQAEQGSCEVEETENHPGNQYAECGFECERYHVLELYVHGGKTSTHVRGSIYCGARQASCEDLHECRAETDPTVHRSAGYCAARTIGEFWMADDLRLECKAKPAPCQDDLDPAELELCAPGASGEPGGGVSAVLRVVDGVAIGEVCRGDVCTPVAPTCSVDLGGRTCAIGSLPEGSA